MSKIRHLVDEPGRQRLRAQSDTVLLDLSDYSMDARDIAHASQAGLGSLGPAQARALAALFEGEFLDGLEIDRCPAFGCDAPKYHRVRREAGQGADEL